MRWPVSQHPAVGDLPPVRYQVSQGILHPRGPSAVGDCRMTVTTEGAGWEGGRERNYGFQLGVSAMVVMVVSSWATRFQRGG